MGANILLIATYTKFEMDETSEMSYDDLALIDLLYVKKKHLFSKFLFESHKLLIL